MNFNKIKKIIKNKLGASTKVKDIGTNKDYNLSLNISIEVPFLNNVSDGIMFNLITQNNKTYLTDDTWLNDDLETMGLYDNSQNVLKVKKYIQKATNNGELPIIYNKNKKELRMPVNDIKDLPFSIEMFTQEIVEIIASANTVIFNQD